MRIHLDDSELRNLEVDLRGAPYRLQRNALHATRKGARLIEKAMKVDAAGHRYLRHLPRAVSYDVYTPYDAEIGLGPKRGTQGSLAHIIAYGSVNNAPVYDHTAGPRRVEPQVVEHYADAAEESVLGGDKS